jgi:hypothetical protein
VPDNGRVTTQLSGEGRPMSTRTKVLIAVGGAIMLFGMLVTAVFNYLLAPPQKVLVVTMEPTAGQAGRQVLKDDCGHLPGVTLVEDKGDRDPVVQGRFPVRFDIGGANLQQETALAACINAHRDLVRGFLSEGDR